MRTASCCLAFLVMSLSAARAAETPAAKAAAWPQWRGPLATGAAPDAAPPVAWGEGTNVRWKVAIPGRGHSSPVLWNDRIFLTAAVETDQAAPEEVVKAAEGATPEFHRGSARQPRKVVQFVVLAVKRGDGSVLWKQVVCEKVPHAGTHADGSWASGSAVTDGERVYAYFGSYGLYALDLDGNRQWERQFGDFKIKANFGEGTSPVLCGDALILCQDQEGASFIAALDRKTGADRWRVERDETTSWATPLVVEHKGRRQIVTSASKRIRGYEAGTGALLWESAGMTANVIPSPVEEKGLLFCASGFRGNSLMAIWLDKAKGDLAARPEALAWSLKADTPYVPSPLLQGGLLYYLKGNKGELTCVEAATGRVVYGSRPLEGLGTVYASPVGAAGRVYVTGREGLTVVVAHGPEFSILARNKLEDGFTASAAVAGGELYLRGNTNLYCIGAP